MITISSVQQAIDKLENSLRDNIVELQTLKTLISSMKNENNIDKDFLYQYIDEVIKTNQLEDESITNIYKLYKEQCLKKDIKAYSYNSFYKTIVKLNNNEVDEPKPPKRKRNGRKPKDTSSDNVDVKVDSVKGIFDKSDSSSISSTSSEPSKSTSKRGNRNKQIIDTDINCHC